MLRHDRRDGSSGDALLGALKRFPKLGCCLLKFAKLLLAKRGAMQSGIVVRVKESIDIHGNFRARCLVRDQSGVCGTKTMRSPASAGDAKKPRDRLRAILCASRGCLKKQQAMPKKL